MRIIYSVFVFILSFSIHLYAEESKGTLLMKQAQTFLEQKDYTKARYLYIQAYAAFESTGNYAEATECGTKGVFLYYRENYYKEAFDLCRKITQFLQTEEQKAGNVLYEARFLLLKEQLQMYIRLKKPAQAELQLAALADLASRSNSDDLAKELLYVKVGCYYAFGKEEQGDAAFQELIGRYREQKAYEKVSTCYKNLIGIALRANDASLMDRTYARYIVWADSVKAFNAEDKLGALQLRYEDSLATIQEKDDQLSGKHYFIVGLGTLALILFAAWLLSLFALLRFSVLNKKLKQIIRINKEHNEQQTKFIQCISAQLEPTLDKLNACIGELPATVAGQSGAIRLRVDALRQFCLNIQELSLLEGSLMEPYEVQSFSVGTFCRKTMDLVKDGINPGVEIGVDAPQLEIKTNAVQLERILLHLLTNAARYTSSGKITLEFKRKGAHLCHFVVTDSGEGMSAERKEHLLKPFTEAKDLAEGDGLGLPICALIANKLNGSLSIDMEYKKGCRFVLSLQV